MEIRDVKLPALLPACSLACLGLACGGGATPEPDPGPAPGFFSSFRGGVDEAVWTKGENMSFPGNGTYALPSEVTSSASHSSLNIHRLSQTIGGKYYSSGTLVSKRLFSYGTFTVRLRAPIISGSTCSFFLMNPYQSGHWLHKEIDIEVLGKAQDPRNTVQFTVHRYYQDTEQANAESCVATLAFDVGTAFHEYSIQWAPGLIRWFVDGTEVCREAQRVPDEPLNIYMNHWVYDPFAEPGYVEWGSNWLGPLNDEDLPSRADYEWVRYDPLETTP